MNDFHTNDSLSENIKEEDMEDYPNSLNNSNSNFNNEINSMYNGNETIYANEYVKNEYNFYQSQKHKTIIDYLNINSDEYKKNKMSQKIKLMLYGLHSLSQSNIDEICYLSWYYSQKLSHKKLSTIVQIIVYKIIKKYNIKSISLKDLKNKLNFRYKTYLKNEKLFPELDNHKNISIITNTTNTNTKSNKDIQNKNSHHKFNIISNNIYCLKIPNISNYSDSVYNSTKKYIKTLKEKSQSQTNKIKLKGKKGNKNNMIIEKIFEKFKNDENNVKELYCNPIIFELNKCQEQCKCYIYNDKRNSSDIYNDETINGNIINLKEENEKKLSDENNFENYFKDKINSDILGLGMIKYFIDKNKIIILSYNIIKEIFNCNIHQVKKSILYINLYNKYINNI